MPTTPTSAVKVNAATNALVIPTVANFCSANGIAQLSDLTSFFDYKGGQDCSANPNYPAASKGDVYSVTVAGKIGGASGVVVAVGDTFLATADNVGGTQAAVGSSWLVSQANIDLADIDITGGTINGTVIGGTTPAAGTFTDLYADTFNDATITVSPGVLEIAGVGTSFKTFTSFLCNGAVTFTSPLTTDSCTLNVPSGGSNVDLPTSGTLLSTAAIGVSVQAYDADLTTWAGITPAANVGTFLATPSSANLLAAITDETGTGALVFGTSPTITTSLLCAAASFTAFAGATTLLTIGGTGASASLFAPSTLDATSSTTGAIRTSGGISCAKAANIGTTLTVGTNVSLASASTLNWSTDAGIIRSAANVLKVTNGSSGYGIVDASNFRISGFDLVVATYGIMMRTSFPSMYLGDTGTIKWNNSGTHDGYYSYTQDIGLARDSAGVLRVSNGSTGYGALLIAAGGSSVTGIRLGGVLKDFFTDVGNITTGEDDLYTYTVPASVLGTNGHKLEAEFSGIFVSAATETLQLKAYFGGTQIFATGALTIAADSAWELEVTIIRVSATVVRCSASLTTQGATLAAYTAYTEVTGLTLSSTNILKITGEAAGAGAATNHIIAKLGNIKWMPEGT